MDYCHIYCHFSIASFPYRFGHIKALPHRTPPASSEVPQESQTCFFSSCARSEDPVPIMMTGAKACTYTAHCVDRLNASGQSKVVRPAREIIVQPWY
jgi:hypothetical protein